MIVFLIGVSGCGKTAIGQVLAQRLHCEYFEADDFHTPENRQKMREGVPLTDEDRWPWLTAIANKAKEQEDLGQKKNKKQISIFLCSALKRSYREMLVASLTSRYLMFYLQISEERARVRVLNRHPSTDNCFHPTLVKQQFEVLEVLTEEEQHVITVECAHLAIIDDILRHIHEANKN